MTDRQTIFISHATPSDNAFATWLASRLAMAGYKVWCDQEKLLGGEDFWQDIEDALRNDTIKFVLVISEQAFDENGRLWNGIQKEVALADIMKKQLNDDYFIVPIRIDETKFSDFSIDFIRLNGIDASKNWASGLSSLIKVLKRDAVPFSENMSEPSLEEWRSVHQFQKQAIEKENERLQSNWLSIRSLPDEIFFYDFQLPVKSGEPRSIASSCILPCSDHSRLLVSFAGEEEIQEALGERIPIKHRGTLKTENFLQGNTGQILGIKPYDAKNKVSSMIRQGWDSFMRDKGLIEYPMSHYLAWWFPEDLLKDGKLKYRDFNDQPRYRVVSGVKGKIKHDDGSLTTRYHWHLGMTAKPMLGDNPVLMLQPRIIITDADKKPLMNKTRLNSVRRSTTNMWFNDKWRSMMLGFCSWLSNDEEEFLIPLAKDAFVKVSGQPELFDIPISIKGDPVRYDLTDEVAEKSDHEEKMMRLSDPAFLKVEVGENDDE
tara:strand:+ start:6895 stop:8358 length:1464 start_codon:yes stop_codon:yes gene_type:complete